VGEARIDQNGKTAVERRVGLTKERPHQSPHRIYAVA
jgi:hypothetical protein